MKVLLDANVAHDLRAYLAHHEAVTAAYMGWTALHNGVLLDAAENAGFDVMITGDKTLRFEQNLTERKIALVCLSAISWPVIAPHVSRIVAAVDEARPGSVTGVECGEFVRQSHRPKGPPIT